MSVAHPQWLLCFADMPLLNHPQVFACLTLVMGLYGLLYMAMSDEATNPFGDLALAQQLQTAEGVADMEGRGEWQKGMLLVYPSPRPTAV